MPPKLEHRFAVYDRTRTALLDVVSETSEERLIAKPGDDAWSVRQIVEHIVISEREVLMGLPALTQLMARIPTPEQKVRYQVALWVLRFGIPVDVPSPTMLPQGELPLATLCAMWDENQQWLRRYVAQVGDAELGNTVFHHPITGPLDVWQVVQMGHLHLRLHARQIRRRLGV